MATLQLIDDDAPWRFAPRVVTVVRDDVRVAGKPGVVVTIEQPLTEPDIHSGELASAILVPRQRNVRYEDLRSGSMETPGSVFVLRFSPSIADLPRELAVDAVVIEFWGLVGNSVSAVYERYAGRTQPPSALS